MRDESKRFFFSPFFLFYTFTRLYPSFKNSFSIILQQNILKYISSYQRHNKNTTQYKAQHVYTPIKFLISKILISIKSTFCILRSKYKLLQITQRTITYLVIKILFPPNTSLFLLLDYKSTETKYRTRFHARERMQSQNFISKIRASVSTSTCAASFPKNIFESGQVVHYPATMQTRFETHSQTRNRYNRHASARRRRRSTADIPWFYTIYTLESRERFLTFQRKHVQLDFLCPRIRVELYRLSPCVYLLKPASTG